MPNGGMMGSEGELDRERRRKGYQGRFRVVMTGMNRFISCYWLATWFSSNLTPN